jgi:hypothetical protein
MDRQRLHSEQVELSYVVRLAWPVVPREQHGNAEAALL